METENQREESQPPASQDIANQEAASAVAATKEEQKKSKEGQPVEENTGQAQDVDIKRGLKVVEEANSAAIEG